MNSGNHFELGVQNRTNTESNKNVRNQGFVPACIYGKHHESTNIKVAYKDLQRLVKAHSKMIHVNLFGSNKKVMAGVSEIQVDPATGKFLHLSLHAVNANEETHLKVDLVIKGKAKGQTSGGVLAQQINSIDIYGPAANLPGEIEVDISGLELGQALHVSEIPTKGKFRFAKKDQDKAFVVCNYPKLVALPEDEKAEEVVQEVVLEETTTPVESQDQKETA